MMGSWLQSADLTPGTYDERDSNITFTHRTNDGGDAVGNGSTVIGDLYQGTRSYSQNVAAEFVFTVVEATGVSVTGQVVSGHGTTLVTITNLTDSVEVVTDATASFKGPGDARYNDYEVFNYNQLDPNKQYEVKFHTFSGYGVFDKVSVLSPSALEFDGTNDRITIPSDDTLNLNINNFSLATWIKPSDVTRARADIISHGQNGVKWDSWTLSLRNDKVDFRYGGGAAAPNQIITQTGTIEANKWTHVAVTFDSGATKLYINGVLDNSASLTGIPGNSSSITQIAGDSGPRYMFAGTIDDLSIWNKTLADADVTGLKSETFYNDSSNVYGTISETQIQSLVWADLIAYFPMDEFAGTTATDISSTAFVGTFVDSPTWVPSSNDIGGIVILPKPTTLQTTSISDTGCSVSWDAMDGADDYTVTIATDANLNSELTGFPVAGETATTYDFSSLTTDTTYYIGVKARYGTNFSAYEVLTVTTSYDAGVTDGVQYSIANKWTNDSSRWNINSVTSVNGKSNINNSPNTTNSWYVNQSDNFTVEAFADSSFSLTIKTNDPWSGGKIWIDWNHDGIFNNDLEFAGYFVDDAANIGNPAYDNYFGTVLPTGGNTVTINVPESVALPVLPFTTRIRLKTTDIGNYNPNNLLPDSSKFGQAQDYGLTIVAAPTTNYTAISASSPSSVAGVANNIILTAKIANSTSTLTSFTGTHDVRISGVTAAPDGSYGTFNGVALTADAIGGQVIPVSFSNGVATAPLVINCSGSHNIQFEVKDIVNAGSYDVGIGEVPPVVHATCVALNLATDLVSNSNHNGGVFVPQPVVELVDVFQNVCDTDSTTQITASKNSVEDPDLIGTTMVTAVNGVVTFSNLGNMNLSSTTLFGVATKFSNQDSSLEVTSNAISLRGEASGAGNCLQLSGTEYGDLGALNYLKGSQLGSVTVEAWINIAAFPTDRMAIVGSTDNGSFQGVNFGVNSTGGIFFVCKFFGSSQSVNGNSSDNLISLDTWHHVAVSYDKDAVDKTIQFYVDGVAAGSIDITDTATTPWDKQLRYVGQSSLNNIDNFVGEIDELRIWNVPRTQQEVMDNKNGLVPPTTRAAADPVAYYTFDTVEGPFASDHSTNSAPLEIVNYSDDSIWQTSDAVVTPVIGLDVTQAGNSLTWSVEDESSVKEYKIVNAKTGEVIAVIKAGQGQYNYQLDTAEAVSLIVIDQNGFTQTFFPNNGDKVTVEYVLSKGWNLISVPGENADLSQLNKVITGLKWGWNGTGYVAVNKPAVGQAIWVNAPEAVTTTITAEKCEHEIILETGWNMVGTPENCYVPNSATVVYSWNESYQTIAVDNGVLLQGVGYWIFSF